MKKIVAVIVTYNRLALLKKAIERLRTQTRKLDDIIIINNSSTDGTKEWLEAQSDLITITQENLGGSGGFFTGIEEALKGGYDWIFLADDDGEPSLDAIELLEDKADDASYSAVCCSVISNLNSDKLAFSLPRFRDDKQLLWGKNKRITDYDELVQLASSNGTYPLGSFFNGCLLSSKAIGICGNVNKSMFISGDEIDMMWRLNKYLPVVTLVDAKHYHPPAINRELPTWRRFYQLRNNIYNIRHHYNYKPLRLIITIVRNVDVLTMDNGIKYYFKAINDGFFGKLGKL
ncbi:glycosyltransferase [Vibrio sp. F13]|uniref:glycosyltransferase n=1 Tax=Vibrio sp. F13 TaxID=2070777 RepID=UPI0010BDE516|nr:glycosyltransferase [Vibrio sp. F13]TKF73103.1 glycosyltransferase [Vibrio sp. F13]